MKRRLTPICLLLAAIMLCSGCNTEQAEGGEKKTTNIESGVSTNDKVIEEEDLPMPPQGETDGFVIEGRTLVECRNSDDNIVIPEGVTEISDIALNGSYQMIYIPEGVERIDEGAFSGDYLKTISIPYGVTCIDESTFSRCKYLSTVILPESITNIQRWAFEGCSNLTEICLPDNIVYVSEDIFQRKYDSEIIETTIIYRGNEYNSINALNNAIAKDRADDPLVIVNNCVAGCYAGATEVTIPEGVTGINAYAFKNCIGLKEINIPESVTRIDKRAFENCVSLKEINIGKNVTYLGKSVLSGCNGITNINFILPDDLNTFYEFLASGNAGNFLDDFPNKSDVELTYEYKNKKYSQNSESDMKEMEELFIKAGIDINAPVTTARDYYNDTTTAADYYAAADTTAAN